MTTPDGGSCCQLVPGGVSGTVGAFVDMLSRQNYVYVQPFSPPGADRRRTAAASDQPTAATGSLTDLFGRVAALPESQTRPPCVPAPPVSVVVSGMDSVAPSQPVTMFRIVGGTPPQQVMAYRHRPTHVDQRPVLLPASAVRPLHQPSPFVVDPALSAAALGDHAGGAARRGGAEPDVGRVEAEAHELTRDAGGREMHRCRLCARLFTAMAAFRSHVLTTHCRHARNQCAVCGKHFSRSWLLKGHMRTHTGERPYRCPHAGCERAFADKSNLRSHLLIHSADGKHYVCSRCNRAFAQKRYLHKHRLEVCKV